MSIRDNMIQQVLGNPGKYSIQQLQDAMKSGSLPAYVVVPIIQDKMQQQKQMQAAMMQQPPQSTVADQIMQEAQMTQGVDALRSNLPEDYAHGGIVAFDDGGEVERYQTGRLVESEEQRRAREAYRAANPFLRESDELEDDPRVASDRKALGKIFRAAKAVGLDALSLPGRAVAGAAEYAVTRPLRALGVPIPYLPKEFYGGDPTAISPRVAALQREETPTGLPTAITRPETDMGGAAPKGVGGPGAAGPGAGAAPAGVAGLGVKRPYIQSAQDRTLRGLYGTEEQPGLIAQTEKIIRDREDFINQAEGMVTGKAYEGLESSLRKEAEEFGADKEQAKNMAMLKAGLAIMAGTSRHALENIGKGAMVGAEDYQKAAADIKKAKKENDRMMAYIEQARRAEDAGKRDRAIANYDKAAAARQRMNEFVFSSLNNAGIRDDDRRFEEYKIDVDHANRKQLEYIKQEGGIERVLARAALAGGGEKGAATESQMANIRAKVIEKLDSEGFELQKYREVIGNPKLKTDQLQAIVKDPKNANIVRQVQQARREEIERRLMEQLGRYPTSTGQTAPQAAPQMSIVGYRPQ